MSDEIPDFVPAEEPRAGGNTQRGGNAAHMAKMRALRAEQAVDDPRKLGRSGKRLSSAELDDLQRRDILDLRAKAIEVLKKTLGSKDEGIRQRAAKMLLDWEAKQEDDEIDKVVYVTAAMPADMYPILEELNPVRAKVVAYVAEETLDSADGS